MAKTIVLIGQDKTAVKLFLFKISMLNVLPGWKMTQRLNLESLTQESYHLIHVNFFRERDNITLYQINLFYKS